MSSAILVGVMFGLSAGFAPGPLMALVITHAVRHNTREGMLVAVAPLLTDLPIVLASLFVLSRFADVDPVLGSIALVGGGYVAYLSYETFRPRPAVAGGAADACPRSLLRGALINALNPHPYLFWVTVGGPFVLALREGDALAPWAFIASFYVFLVGSKVFIAGVVGRFRSLLEGAAYVWMMRALGSALAAFAVLLVRHGLALAL